MAMRMDVGFYKGMVHPIAAFVPFIAKNGDAYGRWLLQGVVHPIAACLSHSWPRLAMQKWTLALTAYSLSNSRFFVPFIAKNGDAYMDAGFTECGSSNSRLFGPCIAKNGDAYGTLALQRCGLSNSRLYVPFITKNVMQKWMLAFTVCGSSNSRLFVPFHCQEWRCVWTLALTKVVCPIAASLSLSLPRMAEQRWTLAFTKCMVCPIAASLSLSLPRMTMQKWTLAFAVCSSSNSRLFDPFIAKNGNAEVDVGYNIVCRFFPFIAKNGDAYGRAFTCGSSNSRFFVPFIAKNGNAYGRWLYKGMVCPIATFVPFIAKNGDAYGRWLYKGVVHPIAACLLSLPRMAMRMGRLALQMWYGLSNSRFFVPFIAKNADAYGSWLYGVVHPIAALSHSLPRMAMRKWTLALQRYGLSNSHFFVHFIAKNDGMEVGFTKCGSSNSRLFVPFIAKNGDAYGTLALTKCMVYPIAVSLSLSLPRMTMKKWTLAFTVCGLSNSRLFDPFIAKNGNAEVDTGFNMCGSSNSRLFDPFIAKNGNAEVDAGFNSMLFVQ
ncbi:hypothetical protein K7X08_002689 [Anisodus acutangulus]|uniref:Uncharacterized protein n=1 Tax=Anisodus acutangulus TaxID=402998 RepID=A0A9Q1QT05_9SOLA|nr:hypothetical protein K7X08_002689 [Anisodus acutangulus]